MPPIYASVDSSNGIYRVENISFDRMSATSKLAAVLAAADEDDDDESDDEDLTDRDTLKHLSEMVRDKVGVRCHVSRLVFLRFQRFPAR